MVLEAGDLGLGAVVWTLVGLVAGSYTAAVIIAMVCARLGRRQLGCGSLVMSWALAVTLGVVAVVLWRTKDGEATLYDWLWAIALGAVGSVMARRLWRRRPRAEQPTIPEVPVGDGPQNSNAPSPPAPRRRPRGLPDATALPFGGAQAHRDQSPRRP